MWGVGKGGLDQKAFKTTFSKLIKLRVSKDRNKQSFS